MSMSKGDEGGQVEREKEVGVSMKAEGWKSVRVSKKKKEGRGREQLGRTKAGRRKRLIRRER